jgi:hypothetical protein
MLLLGLEILLLRSEKNDTLTVSMEIHKGATFLLPHINENSPQALSPIKYLLNSHVLSIHKQFVWAFAAILSS